MSFLAYGSFNHFILLHGFPGDNGTVDGQGAIWWEKFHKKKLKYTRGYMVELMHSNDIVISNLTFLNSPAWNLHPVYSRYGNSYKWKIQQFFMISKLRRRFDQFIFLLVAKMFSNILIQHVTILAPLTSPNTDGIDPG